MALDKKIIRLINDMASGNSGYTGGRKNIAPASSYGWGDITIITAQSSK